MQDRSSKDKKKQKRGQGPPDPNVLAYNIVQQATGQAEKQEPPERQKHQAAVTLGRLGGLKGGKARAEKLTPEQRAEIARKAAEKRWHTAQASGQPERE